MLERLTRWLKFVAMIPILLAFIWIMRDYEERTFGGTIVGTRTVDEAVIVTVRDAAFRRDEEAIYEEIQVGGAKAEYAKNRSLVFLFVFGLAAITGRALKLI